MISLKSQSLIEFVIPAKLVPAGFEPGAEIQLNQGILGSRLRGSDGLVTSYEINKVH